MQPTVAMQYRSVFKSCIKDDVVYVFTATFDQQCHTAHHHHHHHHHRLTSVVSMLARVRRFPRLSPSTLNEFCNSSGIGAMDFYWSDALPAPNQAYQSMQGNSTVKKATQNIYKIGSVA